ncbi:short-chain fatty acid transporter [Photobacterium ganghwense]|uniref:Short-chain fatty acid transporter n=1 Tax=Photobacterium ganghwense TaxID=320778 RepID=A0A0J1GX77_9GAMM|nr:short-chain fatty acid transporter [Photobacterium ganghwense]KLV04268.1 short-chain fatty acid transporter [Photobacterium ganghwense]PSU08104.1 short-chain fatty acid transporter [Photobacterium ganghwense]QSV14913.1 short-chain fatty acid transporter [Photobacterium ganghwense]
MSTETVGFQQSTLLQRFSFLCTTLVQRYLPDPFLFAAILTFVVFLIAMPVTQQSPMQMVDAFAGGFWNLLTFAMQMAMVVVTGHAMASAPVFKRSLAYLAMTAKTPGHAIFIVTLVSAIACWINWGFGLVVGAIFARELAAKVKGVDYRLLIASAYTGFLFWHAGLSGSIPLALASGSNLEVVTAGAVTQAISTNETLFSASNLLILAVMLLVIPLLNKAMHPSQAGEVVTIDPALLQEPPTSQPSHPLTPAEKLEHSPWVNRLLALLGFSYIISYFVEHGFALNLNIVNFIFLFTAILLHDSPKQLIAAVAEGTKNTAGILLQFPFYAGIMGMMVAKGPEGISLAGAVSDWFVSISTPGSFPLFTFLSAGIVNFFVPSGGGQWAVQAPIMMPAGEALGVPAAKTAMAIAWGDAWTNMIQPFWALPALSIAGLNAKDIMGYCLVALLASGLIIGLGLVLF